MSTKRSCKGKNSTRGGRSSRSKDSYNKVSAPSNSKRSNAPSYDDEMKFRGTDPVKDRTNDPNWYAANPQLLTAAGSYAFSDVLGTDLPWGMSIPGVCAYTWAPVPGDGTGATIATRNVYSFVRHANSGSANYDAPDLMMYIMAVDSAFSYIAMLERAYGVARLYNQRNKYMPQALIEAMGIDFEDLIKHLADMNYYINNLVARASVLWIPNTMPFVTRHFWMNSNVFSDGASAKAQIYMPVQAGYLKYNATKTPQGGGLDYVAFFALGQKKTYGELINFAEDLFSQLDANNEDFGIMAGDILKAYGQERIYTLNEIPFDHTVLPVYSPEVLSQIHNMTMATTVFDGIRQTVQGKIELIFPSYASKPDLHTITPQHVILDYFQGDTPTPEQVMVGTRLTRGWTFLTEVTSGGNTTWTPNITSLGTEMPLACCLYYYKGDTLLRTYFTSLTASTDISGLLMDLYTKFDWAPFIYVTDGSDPTTSKIVNVIGDVETYTTMDHVNIQKLNTVATWSEFGIPAM